MSSARWTSIATLREAPVPASAMLGACRSVSEFEKLNRVGEGTFGIVYRARDQRSGQVVALKRVKMTQETGGLPLSSLREVALLRRLRHVNVVSLLDVVVGRELDSVFLALEYCEQDLGNLLDHMPLPFSDAQVKCLVVQLLRGLAHLHAHFVVHRDVKMSNLLLTAAGVLKVADFGLARSFGLPIRPLSPRVVTLWYRAPELLFGSTTYDTAIDCWSAGCVLGELLLHTPLMPATTEAAQVNMIVALLGTPTEKLWPGFTALPLTRTFVLPVQPYNCLRDKFSLLSPAGLDLLHGLLTYDPALRMTVREALQHAYLTSDAPLPCHPDLLPTFPDHRFLAGSAGNGGAVTAVAGAGLASAAGSTAASLRP